MSTEISFGANPSWQNQWDYDIESLDIEIIDHDQNLLLVEAIIVQRGTELSGQVDVKFLLHENGNTISEHTIRINSGINEQNVIAAEIPIPGIGNYSLSVIIIPPDGYTEHIFDKQSIEIPIEGLTLEKYEELYDEIPSDRINVINPAEGVLIQSAHEITLDLSNYEGTELKIIVENSNPLSNFNQIVTIIAILVGIIGIMTSLVIIQNHRKQNK